MVYHKTSFTLLAEQYDRLEAQAKAEDRSLSSVVRIAIEKYLAEQGKAAA